MKTEERIKIQKAADGERARAIEAAANSEYMSAAFHTAAALKKYERLSDGKKIKELKSLLVEYNSKAEPLKSHLISIPLTDEIRSELDDLIDSYTNKNTLAENLLTLAKSATLLPRLDEAKKNAKEIRPVTAQLFTHMLLDDDGHTKSYDDFETTWLHENYDFQINLTNGLLDMAMSKLVTSGQFNREAAMDVFASKGLFSIDHLLKLDAALERRFEDDYFSAVHILTPLIESSFMHLSKLVGLDTITFSGKQMSTRNKNLSSEILQSKEYGEAWSIDFCYMLSFFMYEPTAHRFRHKVAHGDIKMNECNFTTFNILFYFLNKMTMMINVETKVVPS